MVFRQDNLFRVTAEFNWKKKRYKWSCYLPISHNSFVDSVQSHLQVTHFCFCFSPRFNCSAKLKVFISSLCVVRWFNRLAINYSYMGSGFISLIKIVGLLINCTILGMMMWTCNNWIVCSPDMSLHCSSRDDSSREFGINHEEWKLREEIFALKLLLFPFSEKK